MRSRRIGRRRWRSGETDTLRSPASPGPSWPRCSASLASPMADERPRRILVVDDHPDNVMVLRARLEARGYVVDSAEDGEAALERIHEAPPDLVLLDVMMPKMDGFEVVRRM